MLSDLDRVVITSGFARRDYSCIRTFHFFFWGVNSRKKTDSGAVSLSF